MRALVHLKLSSRTALLTLWGLGLGFGAMSSAGCAHSQAHLEAPEGEVDRLRQDNAAMRLRVRKLEQRVQLLERNGVPGPGDDAHASRGGERALPVVRLEAPEDDDEPTPREYGNGDHTRVREAVTLQRAEPDPGFDDPYAGQPNLEAGYGSGPVAHGEYAEQRVPAEWQAEPPTPAPEYSVETSESDEGAIKSYRLVGSHLVNATKKHKPKADKPPRGKRGSAIIAEYERARSIYKQGDFARAEAEFDGFVQRYPRHDYADNALYWKGEAAYDQAHYADALASFTAVVERYGGGNKAPDALLKIGLCYGKVGDEANARDVLEQLIAAYPRANASKIARKKLPEFSGQ